MATDITATSTTKLKLTHSMRLASLGADADAELADRNIWFEPMMNTIAKELLRKNSLGLKCRVGLGASLSIG